MKKRNLRYEEMFKKYLFKFDFETHKKICENINVKHNQEGKNNPIKENLREMKGGKKN